MAEQRSAYDSRCVARGYLLQRLAAGGEADARHATLLRALRRAGEEFARRCGPELAEATARLRFTPGAEHSAFLAVAEELFRGGCNWGRVVALLEFACSVQKRGLEAERVAGWTAEVLDGPLREWMCESGGWNAFLELYGEQQQETLFLRSWPSMKTVFGLAALGAAGITIGTYFTRK